MKTQLYLSLFAMGVLLTTACCQVSSSADFSAIEQGFVNPPDSARPGVYWYFMDGNISKEGMTKDLEAMKQAGIGNVVYLEVNVGIPRGKIDFLSDEWQDMFKHAVSECERLGINITLGVGPGWTGSGGPWVEANQSMQHLVYSSTEISGAGIHKIQLPKPGPKQPFFGEGAFTPGVKKQWEDYYEDVAVLAFPAGTTKFDTARIAGNEYMRLSGIEEEALYYRKPYSSVSGVRPYLPTFETYAAQPEEKPVKKDEIVDLTGKLQSDGSLTWDVPAGKWTVMRFGSRSNGAVTRPAPIPGVGLESDKFDTTALNAHLDKFTGKLFQHIKFEKAKPSGGLRALHMDSWEMGAQNWTARFREEFKRRRGYDPLPFYPVYAGEMVQSREMSERFLWDLRITSQELILENHANHIKAYGRRYGLALSIEPYDMNPTADLELGAVADLPMCEFWSLAPSVFGYNTSFSAVEGSSLAHLKGQPVVQSESFTAANDGWRQHPASMKNQTDWALAAGINRLFFHTFQHQALNDKLRPGMTMGPYGVHWDRNQTWWPMADAYHRYLSRCQFMLQQGRTVADVLYLAPEGAPHVFRAPQSALAGVEAFLPDRKGYSFDACPPSLLYQATVCDGQVIFPSGATYRLLALPAFETMTPELLKKIKELVQDGATVVGIPPKKSPSLVNYPACDEQLQTLVQELWGGNDVPEKISARNVGKGKIIWGKELTTNADNLYPRYDVTAGLLSSSGIPEDFVSLGPLRYTHRTMDSGDIYFIANYTDKTVNTDCLFRLDGKQPELWDPMTGEMRALPEYFSKDKRTSVTLSFEPYQSYFVIFRKSGSLPAKEKKNFPEYHSAKTLDGSWSVAFDPTWGGPASAVFDQLTDWSMNTNLGIKYYSGKAVYTKTFDLSGTENKQMYLDLGNVKNIARVSLNGKDLGIVWTTPWRVDITDAVKQQDNNLKIEVINLWGNRLIGDEQLPDDGIKGDQWPDWLLKGASRPSGRYTFTTYKHYTKDSPLQESGLIGPVTVGEIVWK